MKLPAFLERALHRTIETTDRGVLLWVRWLFILTLSCLFLYSTDSGMANPPAMREAVLLAIYIVSNIALTIASRRGFSVARWSIPIFVADLVLIGVALRYAVGQDMDLYMMCFVILYLSTMGRSVRQALPVAGIAFVIYGLLQYYRQPDMDFLNPHFLLRFPFFLIFSLFTLYLTEQVDAGRKKIEQMGEVQHLLADELQKAMVQLRDKQTMLVQAEKLSAMGNMAGALAHEIRNPLSVIVGYVEDLLSSPPTPEMQKKALEAVRRSAVRCQDLMTNLLSFARRPKDAEMFLVKDALQEAMTLVRMGAKMSQVTCMMETRSEATLTGRRSEFQQIFINLMNNAVDAMPKGGTLTVVLEEERIADKDCVKVTVTDTGTGIPDDARAHLFEPFYTTKPTGKGTGLGLSIVRDIVLSYNGFIDVNSEMNKGTTFVVRFPRDTAPIS